MSDNDPTILRLNDQIEWYDHEAAKARCWFKTLKTIELVAAALVPLSAGLALSPWVAGLLGAFVVVVEGVLQLNQFHSNWITYRSTCEALKHEKYLYLGRAPPYAEAADPRALLATRVEELVSREHAKWAGTRQADVEKPARV
jgi:hypothetical protein